MPNLSDIRIDTQIVVLSELMEWLDPNQYQIEWSAHTQSLLIESILRNIV
jgi:hypothetical protein